MVGRTVSLAPLIVLQYAFLCFLSLLEIGSLLCGTATFSNILIMGRAIAGMGSSGLMNGAVISAFVPLEKRRSRRPTMPSLNHLN